MKRRELRLPKTVYLVGAGPGAGVTHTGILLAEFLEERRGARTLFLEVNNHRDIQYIQKSRFSADYESLEGRGLEELCLENYDYIIADMGTDLNFWKKGLPQEARAVLVGSGAPWRQGRFCQAVKGVRQMAPELAWQGVLSLSSQKEARRLTEYLETPVAVLGWQPLHEPLTAACEKVFLSLIQGGRK